MNERLHDLIHRIPKDLKRLVDDVDSLISLALRKEHEDNKQQIESNTNQGGVK